MVLKREEYKRAEGVGWYATYSLGADDVLDHLSTHMNVEEDEPSYHSGRLFKVTVIVEEV